MMKIVIISLGQSESSVLQSDHLDEFKKLSFGVRIHWKYK